MFSKFSFLIKMFPFCNQPLCPGILGIAGNDYIKTIETNETEGYGSS